MASLALTGAIDLHPRDLHQPPVRRSVGRRAPPRGKRSRLGGAAAAGRTMVRSPAAPSPFVLVELLVADSGRSMELGRWCRRRSSAAGYAVIANERQIPQH